MLQVQYSSPTIYHRRAVQVAAPPTYVWAALAGVTMDNLPLSRFLMTVRHLGGDGLDGSKPLLTHGPVRLFHTLEPSYAVGGALLRPWRLNPDRRYPGSLSDLRAFAEPGWAKVVVVFSVAEITEGSRLAAETLIWSTDRNSDRLTRAYWAAIGPFASAVRFDLLRVTTKRALAAQALATRTGC